MPNNRFSRGSLVCQALDRPALPLAQNTDDALVDQVLDDLVELGVVDRDSRLCVELPDSCRPSQTLPSSSIHERHDLREF